MYSNSKDVRVPPNDQYLLSGSSILSEHASSSWSMNSSCCVYLLQTLESLVHWPFIHSYSQVLINIWCHCSASHWDHRNEQGLKGHYFILRGTFILEGRQTRDSVTINRCAHMAGHLYILGMHKLGRSRKCSQWHMHTVI